MTDLPTVSSGANWTPEEDERLRLALRALVAQFADRSWAAVVSRIVRNQHAWWIREKEEHGAGRHHPRRG